MVLRRNSAIRGEMKLLYRVPKLAVVEYLLEHAPQSEITPAFRTVTKAAGLGTKADLIALAFTSLLRVFQTCPSVPEDAARKLHDEYRYRGMKSLYLYECGKIRPKASLTAGALNNKLDDLQADLDSEGEFHGFSNLRVLDIESVVIAGSRFDEISYSYTAPITYTNPKTEYPDVVYDLRSGFIWMERRKRWLAVCARDELIHDLLVKALQEVAVPSLMRTVFPKVLLQQLESYDEIRRAALMDPKTKTTRRWSNPHLGSDDPAALKEVKDHDQRDERMSSGYNQMLTGNVGFALGYTSSRGRIFFSRDLTAEQLRNWGPQKVDTIIHGLRALRSASPDAIARSYADQFFRGYSAEQREAAVEIAEAIAHCRKDGQTEWPLSVDSITLSERLGNLIQEGIQAYSEDNDETVDLQCPACQKQKFHTEKGKLICDGCGFELKKRNLRTADGDRLHVSSLDELVQLLPTDALLDRLSKLLVAITEQPFDVDAEFFYVRDRRLFYSHWTDKIVYRIDEIPELAQLLPRSIPAAQEDALRTALGTFREKCSSMSDERCAGCVANRVGPRCYLRLYGLFDGEYTPRPHQGFEFGDYDRAVTLGRSQKQMVVMMKTGKPGGKPIRHRDSTGRDISTQFNEYMHDTLKDIVGIAIPQRLEASFRAHLVSTAERWDKRIVFLHEAELARILHNSMVRHRVKLAEL